VYPTDELLDSVKHGIELEPERRDFVDRDELQHPRRRLLMPAGVSLRSAKPEAAAAVEDAMSRVTSQRSKQL
jgi:hypothetical protein